MLEEAANTPENSQEKEKNCLNRSGGKKPELPSWPWTWQGNVFSPTVATVKISF